MFKGTRKKWRDRSKESSVADDSSEIGEKSEIGSVRSSVRPAAQTSQPMFNGGPASEIMSSPREAPRSQELGSRGTRSRAHRQDSAQNGGRARMGIMSTNYSIQSALHATMQQPSVANGPLPTHTVLLTGIDAEPRAVPVRAGCSMDEEFYRKNCERPGLCNIQLKAKRATAEDLHQFPARLALADAMKHILWVAENYDALEREFPNHPWNAVMTVETGLDVPQKLLDAMVSSLYTQTIEVEPATVEALMHVADILQVQSVIDALVEYIKVDLIPKHPAACHELGTYVYPQLQLEDAVLQWFKKLQWDGAISQAMLHSIGIVLERCNDDVALGFVKSLIESPSLISPLQAASMSAQLPALKREKLLQGLNIGNLSMGDVQSLLHWANNRRANRAVLADSPILWNLLYNNISSTLLPLEHLKERLGPKAAHMKLWDLPLAHIPPNPGRYKTRRSGWMHLEVGRSFCMEAVYTKDEPGAEWGLFCNPDRQHAFLPRYTIRLCAIQQGVNRPLIELSPDIKPDADKKLGLGMGFDELLSKWAANSELVWEKNGQSYLTLGLYVDLNEEGMVPSDDHLPMSEDPAFVLPDHVATAEIFADKGSNHSDKVETPRMAHSPFTADGLQVPFNGHN